VGFSLKKLAKGALKIGKKIAPQLLKATPLGQLAMRAQQAAKGLGINFKAARMGKPEPVSVQAAIMKPALTMPISRNVSRRGAFTEDYSGRKALRVAHSTTEPAVARALAARRKAAKASGKGRTPPKGGLDLKRIAAMWRAQGKPGTWIGFIKANSDVRK